MTSVMLGDEVVNRTLDDDSDAPTAVLGREFEPVSAEPVRLPGTTLGRYLVTGELGAGGMGRVLRAHDPQLDRDVALKVLRRGPSGRPRSSARARLVREARALAQLSHPNVAAVFDVDASDDVVYIAMELVHGVTLAEWLRDEPSRAEVCTVFEAAGRGLAAAHAAGIVHRDFKPGNVMVATGIRAEGTLASRVRVLDFGLARGFSDGSASHESGPLTGEDLDVLQSGVNLTDDALTRDGAVMGTPAYMAPEQHCGAPPDASTDQFAFCVTLIEALTGRRPFVASDAPTLLDQKLRGELQVDLPPDLPRPLRRAIMRGLTGDPAQRWPSMQPLLAALGPRGRSWTRLGGLGVAAVGLASVAWLATDAPDHCAELADSTVWWTPERADAVRKTAAAANLPDGAPDIDALEQSLQSYADAWATARVAACEAARTETADADTAAGHIACLQDRRRTAIAVVDMLVSATEQTLPGTLKGAKTLPKIEACANGKRKGQTQTESESTPELEAIRERLAQANAFELAGQYQQAQDAARDAVEQAREAGQERLLAAASFRLGRSLGWGGRYPESERALREAFFVASQAGAHDLAFQAADSLVFIVGDPQARYEDALSWAEHAQRELDQLPVDAETEAMLNHSVGLMHARHSNPEAALEHLRKAIALMGQAWGPDDPRLGVPYTNLGNSLMATKQYAEARAAYIGAHERVVQRFGPEHPQVGLALSNVSMAKLDDGDVDGAVADAFEALRVCKATLRPDHHHVANTQYQLGRALRMASRYEEAIAHLETASAVLAELEGYTSFTAPLQELGLARLSHGQPRDAASVLTRALKIEQEARARPDSIAELAFQSARATWEAGEHQQARTLASRAREAQVAAKLSPREIDRWLAERKPAED